MSHAILEKLFAAMQGSKGIPAMEGIVTSVLQTLNDANGSTRLLAQYISEDFALTQKVLKLANSAMYAPFAKEIDSVTAAVNVLGTDVLMHVVLSTGVATAAEISEDKALAKTLMASELARAMRPDRAETVSVAGLMFDLGHLLAARFLPQENRLIESRIAAGQEPELAAREVLGMSLQQLGAEVARRWKLPDPIVAVIEGMGEPELVEVARFSNSASGLILDGETEAVDRLMAELTLPGVDKSQLGGLIRRKLAENPAPAPQTAHPPTAVALEHLRKELAGRPWRAAEELAGAMFVGLARILQTTRCLLLARAATGDFHVRHGQGQGVDAVRARFKVAAEYQPTAFHAAIKNNVDISIEDVGKLRPTALPAGYATFFPGARRFVLLPLAQTQVNGMIYCDWDASAPVNEAELIELKKLRDLLLPFFPG